MEWLESLKGEVITVGGIITETIYAEYGDIAELTVDQLSTSKKVVKYKASDTSDVNYIFIADQFFKWITTTAKNIGGLPVVIQHKNRFGQLLYRKDATQLVMGTDITIYPVYVYDYNELVKAQISFELIGDVYIPVFVFGAGVGQGNNGRAFIYKSGEGLEIDYYHRTTGDLKQIYLSDRGIEVRGNVERGSQ